jgi:hypothetical protein
MACTTPAATPWDLTFQGMKDPANDYKWELYDITKDWTEFDDVAAKNPEKLKEMQEIFWIEAAKYQVLPLDDSRTARFLAPRPSAVAGRTEFTYLGQVAGIPLASAPNFLNRSFTLTADVDVPNGGGEGVLLSFGGLALYILKGKPVYLYNFVGLERTRVEGKEVLSAGKHTIELAFKYDGGGLGKGGNALLKVDGKEVAKNHIKQTIGYSMPLDVSFDVGSTLGTSVDDKDYAAPFKFNGKINKLTVKVIPQAPVSEKDQKKVKELKKQEDDASE